MPQLRAAITGLQGCLPDYILTNDELSRMVDTSDRWIVERTGIKERRILKGEGLGTSHMAAEAVRGLLEKTGTAREEIDLLICATVTPDFLFPSTANLVCDMLSMPHIGSFDILAACSGFVYGLDVATRYVESGRARKVVLVAADKLSAMVDYTDRNSCVLFGDSACATLIEAREDGTGVHDIVLHSDGSGLAHITHKAGGSRRPATAETVARREHFISLNGRVVFREAVERMIEVSAEVLDRNGLTVADIDWFVPHQANLRIVEAAAQRSGVPKDRLFLTVEKFGNTSAASIPLSLWQHEKRLKAGDKVLLTAFGGGFTWGGALVEWAYDGAKAGTAAPQSAAEERALSPVK